MVRVTALAAAFALTSSGAFAAATPKFTADCNGSETIQVNSGPIKTVAYALRNVTIDLPAKSWCRGLCSEDETRDIADVSSTPVKLTDVDAGPIVRHTTIDLKSGAFSNYLRITTKGGAAALDVISQVAATCVPVVATTNLVRVR